VGKVYEWVERFRRRRTILVDEESAERFSTVTYVVVKEQIDRRAPDNRRIDTDKIGSEINIIH
jgi:hypothetical protein